MKISEGNDTLNYDFLDPRTLKTFFSRKAEGLGISMAFLYGSRSKGIPRADSDIDLAVVFEDETLSIEEIFNRLNEISVSLSDITSLEVNVIQISLDFNKPMLYYNAIVLGIPIFLKEPSQVLRLRDDSIGQMEDFQLFGPEWLLSITRKNLKMLDQGKNVI